jgi:hypothetical protein
VSEVEEVMRLVRAHASFEPGSPHAMLAERQVENRVRELVAVLGAARTYVANTSEVDRDCETCAPLIAAVEAVALRQGR